NIEYTPCLALHEKRRANFLECKARPTNAACTHVGMEELARGYKNAHDFNTVRPARSTIRKRGIPDIVDTNNAVATMEYATLLIMILGYHNEESNRILKVLDQASHNARAADRRAGSGYGNAEKGKVDIGVVKAQAHQYQKATAS